MPFYDYKCNACEYTFEKRLHVEDRHQPIDELCPNCGSHSVTIQITCHFERMAPQDLGRVKPNDDWRYFLKKLNKNNPGSSFKTY